MATHAQAKPVPRSSEAEVIDGLQIGVSRPALAIDDLPTPETVFKTKVLGRKEVIKFVLGPSMIALGVSIGSGEWLLGPLAVGQYGFLGIGFIVTISAILQVFYNMEVARFTVATGEVPVVAFTRTPPGKTFWVPFTLLMIYMAWIWGGWASTAGQSLFTLFMGRPNTKEELEIVRLIGIGLMVLAFSMFMFGKKISQTLETFNTIAVWFVLFFLIGLTVVIVPPSFWANALASLVTPAAPPKGIDVSLLGAIAGYTAFASGMNFMLINYYRDKGYGMGSKVGFISGLVGGEKQEVLATGVTFRDTEANAKVWKRWWRYLALDQWGVFFIGAIIGMMIPSILVGWLASQPGAAAPTSANMPIYAATELGRLYGPFLFSATLFVGAFTLFKTQATILEMLIRNTTDTAMSVSAKFRAWTKGDVRRFYYPFAVLLVVVIGVIIHLALPTDLLKISANMANLAAMIFPLVMIYLNSKLPRPARIKWWGYVVLVLNVLFFGFFFINFLAVTTTGTPLVKF
ncbi:MAG: Nramp family divalent metal transporter [Chloroflexi bacterium]|nr:Nramp family divalent metal transporter [Chloroflexota bacterium]